MVSQRRAHLWTAAIVLLGTVNVAFGSVATVLPGPVADFVGLAPQSDSALGELRAVFGGLVLSLGALMLVAPWRRDGPTIAWAVGTCYVGLTLGRLVSLALEGPSAYTGVALGLEGGAAAVLLLGSRALRSAAAA
jgi:hypothetical protein